MEEYNFETNLFFEYLGEELPEMAKDIIHQTKDHIRREKESIGLLKETIQAIAYDNMPKMKEGLYRELMLAGLREIDFVAIARDTVKEELPAILKEEREELKETNNL